LIYYSLSARGLCQFKPSLRIQICPKKGINPTVLFWGWDVSTINPDLGKGSGFLGHVEDSNDL